MNAANEIILRIQSNIVRDVSWGIKNQFGGHFLKNGSQVSDITKIFFRMIFWNALPTHH